MKRDGLNVRAVKFGDFVEAVGVYENLASLRQRYDQSVSAKTKRKNCC